VYQGCEFSVKLLKSVNMESVWTINLRQFFTLKSSFIIFLTLFIAPYVTNETLRMCISTQVISTLTYNHIVILLICPHLLILPKFSIFMNKVNVCKSGVTCIFISFLKGKQSVCIDIFLKSVDCFFFVI